MRIAGCAAAVLVLAVAVVAFAPAIVASEEDQVVITRPGVVFHKAGSDDVRGKSVAKTVDAALESGYTPCRVCFGKELGGNVLGSMDLAAGGAAEGAGEASTSVAAPPSSTVTQPFGVKTRSTGGVKKSVDAARDPYDQPETRKFATVSGAFEER